MAKKGRKRRKPVRSEASRANQRQNKMAMLGISGVVCVLLAALLVGGKQVEDKIAENNRRITEVKDKIAKEESRTLEIGELEEYMKTDEYTEKTLKEKAGFVSDNDIIFKERE